MIENNIDQESSEEDNLLDPIAKAILRELQTEAEDEHIDTQHMINIDGVLVEGKEDEHVNSNHIVNIDALFVGEEEDIKCDPSKLSQSEMIHCQKASESDHNDSSGGKDWKFPTHNPTSLSPSTSRSPTLPTASPSSESTESPVTHSPTHSPTPRGDPYVLLGTIYYDRNVNGQRDLNIVTPEDAKIICTTN